MPVPDWLAFVVLSLAAYRLTRLAIDDTITEPARRRVLERLDPHGWLTELLGCYWCLSLWVSTALVGAWLLAPTTAWVMLPLAISSVVGLLAEHSE
jgi:hypothetical protein